MSKELIDNLDMIATEKATKILPENIKKDVQIFNIVGTYEGGGSGVKLFETQEEMQADTTAKEGDLAVVYRSEVQNATADSQFQTATFPETVVLDTAITDYVDVRYRAVDDSVMFDCMGSLDSSSFRMNCFTESGEIRIQYESSDGITYTRTDTTGNPVDFGTEIYYERPKMWNDTIGKFIQAGESTFEGLYEYKKDENKLIFPTLASVSYDIDSAKLQFNGETINTIYDVSVIKEIIAKMNSEITDFNTSNQAVLYINNDNQLCIIPSVSSDYNFVWTFLNDNDLFGIRYGDSSHQETSYVLDLKNKTYSLYKTLSDTVIGDKYCIPIEELNTKSYWYIYNNNGNKKITFELNYENYVNSEFISNVNTTNAVYGNSYKTAKTQLTLSNSNELLPKKIAYGKNGVIEGNNDLITPNSSFNDTTAMLWTKIQMQYDEMEPRVLTDDDKTIDTSIYCIPTKMDGTPLYDTSNVTNMYKLLYGCSELTTIPLLNTSNVTTMQNMFTNCISLTKIPLLDTNGVTHMNNMFKNCTSLTTIPLLDASSVTDMGGMFYNCTSLTTIPLLNTSSVLYMNSMFYGCTSLTEIPLLDTSNITTMQNMFYDCTSLTTVPLLNTSKVTNMSGMFYNCTSLSEESLNNILAMCINATSYTKTKTLKVLSLTSSQATTCQSLSNYQAFTSAGWTTGY